MENCPFCNPDRKLLLAETQLSYVLANKEPADLGHLLIVPKIHVKSVDCLTDIAAADLIITFKKSVIIIKKSIYWEGINGLLNEGNVAGQTREHFHMHLFTRRRGDNLKNMSRIDDRREEIKESELSLLKCVFEEFSE